MKKPSPAGYLMTKVHNATGKLLAQKLKESNLPDMEPALLNIIYALQQKDGCSIKEISEYTSFGKSTLSSMLDRLEAMHWIRRVHSKEDRRVVHVFLEKSLEEIHALMGSIDVEMVRTFYKGFTKAEVKAFEDALIRILANIESP